MLIDLAIHHRLGKTWFISLIMTVAAIADQVDHKILMEFMSVSESGARGLNTGLRVIGINMNHRDFKSFRKVAGMQAAAGFALCSSKPQLIVSDDMQSATRYIAGNTGKVKSFRNNTLPRK